MMRYRHVDPRSSRAWFSAGLWTLVILALTSLPGEVVETLPEFGLTDAVYHGLVYIPLGALVFRALLLSNPRLAVAGVVLYAAAICIAFAAFDELHQHPIPGRYADIRDWYADGVGIAIGLIPSAILAVRARRKRAREEMAVGDTTE